MTEFRKKLLALLTESGQAKGTFQIYREVYPDANLVHPKGTRAGRYNAVQNGLIWLRENGFAEMYSDGQYHKWYRAT